MNTDDMNEFMVKDIREYMDTHGRQAINNAITNFISFHDNLIPKCEHKWIPLDVTPVKGNIYLRTCALCGCQGLSVVKDD